MEELEADKARGATLGSQISQDMALVIPNDVDHFIKDKMRVKHNIRYMDDGNIIHDSKHFLKNLQEAVGDRFAEIGLTLNPKKTCIVKATKGFMFLKVLSGNEYRENREEDSEIGHYQDAPKAQKIPPPCR